MNDLNVQITQVRPDAAHANGNVDPEASLRLRTWSKAMNDRRIARVRAQVTNAVRTGEPESSPNVRQMLAELERLESLRMAH